ncbi:hypothetical protein T492DRAFT_978928 [Pavlovales sp. CCMP2436]|nr:hypothetical protein T492DRAFT_978928 [Pavlovales sp. CCMP2436]|eukprot:CAMPEP_0179997056 /NCGR_PEP_ID=MMETSP0984-20121128/7929_1 /TAXON_ID=483367 /ORGANISM="non described non described, Strain CCMP 2436" /LENGTH=276 /DNA_ID=CAMNT_0021916617 /DNA_START=105 /DNA_END=935 /DNA_ORIENTATION=+
MLCCGLSTVSNAAQPAVARLVAPGLCQLGEEWTPCTLISKEKASPDSTIFTFGLPDTSKPLLLSTCAAILARGGAAKDVIRPYTPVSTNALTGRFQLLVKVYPDGKLSQYMQALEPGAALDFKHIAANVKLQYPFGKARIGMIAGGTGITPCLQTLHALLGTAMDTTRVSLLYGARTEADVLAKSTLDAWAVTYKERFNVTYVLSAEPEGSSWKGERGHINAERVKQRLPAPTDDCLILLCGPPPMYAALCGARTEPELTGVLAGLGFRAEQVYKF